MRKALSTILAGGAAAALAVGMATPATAGPAYAWGGPGEKTITAIAAGNDNFSYLVSALQATGLDAVLDRSDVTVTVFAPTNAAFEKAADELAAAGVGDGTVPTLLGFLITNDLADDVLLYHVTGDRRFSNSVVPKKGTKSVSTLLDGSSIGVTSAGQVVDAAGATSNAGIVAANIKASNGVIHVIDNVLVPLPIAAAAS